MSFDDKSYSEKRSFIRMKIGAPLSAKLEAERETIEGLCLDLSGSGLQVETQKSLPVGTELDVEVSSGHGHKPTLKAHAKVVRSASNDQGGHSLGLEIIEILQ